jgi:hypothetical protein
MPVLRTLQEAELLIATRNMSVTRSIKMDGTEHTLTRSSEAGCVLRKETFKPPLDFSRAPRRLNILYVAIQYEHFQDKMLEKNNALWRCGGVEARLGREF